MEPGSCGSSTKHDLNSDMEMLFEAFGSTFSIEEIGSAYARAKCSVELTGGILCDLQATTSCKSKAELGEASTSSSKPCCSDASVGQNTTGEGFVRPPLPVNGPSGNQTSDLGANELSACSNSENGGGVEDFIVTMLGDGFQLDEKVIHEVLGLCGYDLEQSMETLVDLSASTLEKSDDVIKRRPDENMELLGKKYVKIGPRSCFETSKVPESSFRSANRNGKESHKKSNGKHDMERELLGTLFTVPDRVEEKPKHADLESRVRRSRIRSKAFGRPVTAPLEETKIEQTFVALRPVEDAMRDEEEEAGESFDNLRQAVKEYWSIMKEYYKASVEAYNKGDQVRAYKFMKEGQFYNQRAREADEKSAKKILETRDQEMLLDVSTLEPREAIKLLRLHLSSLAGISSFPYLKVTVGTDDGDSKQGGPKRLVLKLLEKESIEWTEADNGKTIVLQLDKINPKTLSFAKKQGV